MRTPGTEVARGSFGQVTVRWRPVGGVRGLRARIMQELAEADRRAGTRSGWSSSGALVAEGCRSACYRPRHESGGSISGSQWRYGTPSQWPGNDSLCLRQGLAQVREVGDDAGDTGEREDAEHGAGRDDQQQLTTVDQGSFLGPHQHPHPGRIAEPGAGPAAATTGSTSVIRAAARQTSCVRFCATPSKLSRSRRVGAWDQGRAAGRPFGTRDEAGRGRTLRLRGMG